MRKMDGMYDEYWTESDDDETMDDKIEKIRGTIDEGDYLWCHQHNGMKYDPQGFFFCDSCNMMCKEDTYYMWYLGYDVTADDGDTEFLL